MKMPLGVLWRLSRSILASATLAASCAIPAHAQTDFSKVEIKATKLNDTTYLLTGAGGNIGLSVGDDAVFLVDDQYAPLTPKIVAAIRAITPRPVKFVLNTHWHGDHTGGNEALGQVGALIVAHENVRKRMNSEQFIEFARSTVPPSSPGSLPVVTFAEGLTFHLNGEEIRVFHVPRAHTDGDAVVHFTKGNVIHMGDVYFNGIYPFIDSSSGGTVDGVVAACDRALAWATDRTRIIAGHGSAVSGKSDLQAYRDMLGTISGRIKKMAAEGKKLEEIVAANVSADYDAKWGNGFIKPNKFVEMVAMIVLKGPQ